jgi:hypothetical protein
LSRDAPGFGLLGTVAFFVLVLTPAALRFVEWRERVPPPEPLREEARLAAELGEARDRIRDLTKDLASATGFDVDPALLDERARYAVVVCELLPIDDPSPGRHAIWLRWPGSAESLPSADRPAAAADGLRLAGLIRGVVATLPVARLELPGDPSFRVKFRCGDSLGVLRGTGRSSDDGYALLGVHHVTPLADLPVGAALLTAGGDGVYPPGLLIGRVVPPSDESGDVQHVKAAIRADEITRVVAFPTRWPAIDPQRTYTRRGGASRGGVR